MSGGPYDNFDDTIHSQSTVLDPDNCYNFFIYDDEGGSFVPTLDFYKLKVNNDIIATSDDFGFIDRVGINTADQLASNDITIAKNSINVFPNPTSIEINIVDGKGMNLEILDVVGNSIFKKVNILNLEVIDVSSYKTGVYLVKLSNGHINTSQRILISE